MAKKNAQFKIGETVVYPKHGVGEVVKIETMEVASIKTNFYVVKMEQSKLTIRVPTDKLEQVGLRKVSSKKTIENVFDIFIQSFSSLAHQSSMNHHPVQPSQSSS